MFWGDDVGGRLRGEGVEMEEVDERVSLSDSISVFLALFLVERGI